METIIEKCAISQNFSLCQEVNNVEESILAPLKGNGGEGQKKRCILYGIVVGKRGSGLKQTSFSTAGKGADESSLTAQRDCAGYHRSA